MVCKFQSRREREMSFNRQNKVVLSAKYFNGSAKKVSLFSGSAKKVFFQEASPCHFPVYGARSALMRGERLNCFCVSLTIWRIRLKVTASPCDTRMLIAACTCWTFASSSTRGERLRSDRFF